MAMSQETYRDFNEFLRLEREAEKKIFVYCIKCHRLMMLCDCCDPKPKKETDVKKGL